MLPVWGRPEKGSYPDPCDAGAVLYQLSYQAKRELVITMCGSIISAIKSIQMQKMLMHESHVFQLQIETKYVSPMVF